MYIGHLKDFLDSSSINGLNHISASRQKCVRLFWIIVVFSGFTGAAILIHFSFKSWEESPIKTTIETRPITELIFPKITVCPPKDTFTDLNYDLMMAENMTVDNVTRKEVENYAMELLNDYLYDNVMTKWSRLEDDDKYYNWYHGYTRIYPPYLNNIYGEVYPMFTSAKSGNVSIRFFGDEFDAENVELFSYYAFQIYPPESARYNPNVTLHFKIEKISMKDLSTGKDELLLDDRILDSDTIHTGKNFTPPEDEYYVIGLQRKVTLPDIKRQDLKLMPGFRFAWHYSGAEVEPVNKYYDSLEFRYDITRNFVRKGSKIMKSQKI